MGQAIDRTHFSAEDMEQFQIRLDDSLDVLGELLAQPGFGQGDSSFGAELELVIINEHGRPLPLCADLLLDADDARLTAEINRYNLEANLTPGPMAGTPFRRTETEMVSLLESVNAVAKSKGARLIPIGILPTLQRADLSSSMMTPDERYEALTQELRRRREDQFHIRLKGRERLSFDTDSVAPEGANTSLQIHYRAHPERLVDLYNAIQLVTPLVLGLSANSPFVLGKELWHETRIDLFRQSIDGRNRRRRELKLPQRVHFGHGWLRRSVLELFAETVHLYSPLLPICSEEDPKEPLRDGKAPTLSELALQMGTVWPWNRPVYDSNGEPHVRIELRSLPAGPSAIDMMANAALAIGLAEGLIDDIEVLLHSMPYATLERNLMIAAREGIDANLLWPSRSTRRLESQPLIHIAQQLLPTAESGLTSIGISADEQKRYLGCIERRLETGQTGACWQIDTMNHYRGSGMGRKRALQAMVNDYAAWSLSNTAVSEWVVGERP